MIAPLPLETVKESIKLSPIPDFEAYAVETVYDFAHLLPVNQQTTAQQLAQSIASHYDLTNLKTRLAYSVLSYASLIILRTHTGIKV